MIYYAYMIKSESTRRHYYGHTSDLNDRLRSHNSSQNKYTRGKGPWVLQGAIACDTKGDAIKTEQKLKAMKNPARALHWIKKNGGVVR
jgi:putative endonuclease